MSILIKNMKMPINCIYEENGKTKFCFFCNHDNTPFCVYRGAGLGLDDERPDWCPLVEVPTPHGRLIEVTDELLIALSNFIAETGIDEAPYMSASDWIEMNAPTVIEAEEGE